jgi:hypothetical protein
MRKGGALTAHDIRGETYELADERGVLRRCGRCHQEMPESCVSHHSRYGAGLICQKCSDEETLQAAKSVKTG